MPGSWSLCSCLHHLGHPRVADHDLPAGRGLALADHAAGRAGLDALDHEVLAGGPVGLRGLLAGVIPAVRRADCHVHLVSLSLSWDQSLTAPTLLSTVCEPFLFLTCAGPVLPTRAPPRRRSASRGPPGSASSTPGRPRRGTAPAGQPGCRTSRSPQAARRARPAGVPSMSSSSLLSVQQLQPSMWPRTAVLVVLAHRLPVQCRLHIWHHSPP